MNPEQQMTLIDALMDGDISEADFIRLEAEMIVDPQVRQAYYRRLQLDLLLEQIATEDNDDADVAVRTETRVWDRSRLLVAGFLMTIAASVLLVLAQPWSLVRPADGIGAPVASSDPDPVPVDEISATGFGILSGQADARWDGLTIGKGDLIPQGDLNLLAGTIHIELFSGVQMVIEGESQFSIDSAMQVTMKKGTARAQVPEPAQGFRIRTDAGDVVDLGTEFSIAVEEGGSQVNVVEGEVELHPKRSALRRLRDGEGVRLSSDGDIDNTSRSTIDLVSPEEFQSRLAAQQDSQFNEWNDSIETLREDPRLVALYLPSADNGRSRTLTNRASLSQQSRRHEIAGDGAVVGAQATENRWKKSGGALDFSPMASRVRVTVPGEHRGITLLCWVKINSLDRWYNSLFLTDGHEDREPHWQIMNDGRLFFSVKPQGSDELSSSLRQQQVFYSPKFWNASMSGQWIMLCTVYDVDQQQVTHYVDGRPIGSLSIPDELLVDSIKIGPASICNWSEPMYRSDAEFVVRNLNGSVDEFAIFSGALSSQEILRHYQSGNPNDH